MRGIIKKLQEIPLKNKRVFIRVDFNVPLRETSEKEWEVSDPTRIEGALETIRYVIDQGGKCILASHLGRPDGKRISKYSLLPVGHVLSKLLNKEVILTEDAIGDGPKNLSKNLTSQQILLLENLRFYPGEEQNSEEFAQRLLELCDVYVSDAFGTLHRAHASTDKMPRLAPERAAGLLVQRELAFLEPLKNNPKKPFYLIMGGAKVSDKIGVLEHFLEKVDGIMIGGAMAYAFLKAKDIAIGQSKCSPDEVVVASKILKSAEVRQVPIFLPLDHQVVADFKAVESLEYVSEPNIPLNRMGVDIGPKTIEFYFNELIKAETVFWNGPMGVFEVEAYSKGTFELARRIGLLSAKKLVGGGDSVAAVQKSRCASQYDFLSTGGGATLEYLEGQELPGLAALEYSQR